MKGIITSFLVLVFVFITLSCGDKNTTDPENPTDNYDRSTLLVDIADNFIIPGFTRYAEDVTNLDAVANAFANNPNINGLDELKVEFQESYLTWQKVSMFEIGKAESLALRNNTNIFPANVAEIQENIATGDYNLELPSKIDQQGFPALDYLIYGTASESADVVEYFIENQNARKYLTDLTYKLANLATEVRNDWTDNYRTTFVEKDGSSATSSLNKLVNDYLFYYERFLRAGKIGIPAGIFSGSPLPNKVEGLYSENNSKALFLMGLEATQDFFVGASSFNGNNGESLKTYLDYLDQDGNNLSGKITDQFDVIRSKANQLSDNFAAQIELDNVKMLETYDELQKNVIFLKVDMLQALNIQVDFVDADGD